MSASPPPRHNASVGIATAQMPGLSDDNVDVGAVCTSIDPLLRSFLGLRAYPTLQIMRGKEITKLAFVDYGIKPFKFVSSADMSTAVILSSLNLSNVWHCNAYYITYHLIIFIGKEIVTPYLTVETVRIAPLHVKFTLLSLFIF
jgi:hypothetical protein